MTSKASPFPFVPFFPFSLLQLHLGIYYITSKLCDGAVLSMLAMIKGTYIYIYIYIYIYTCAPFVSVILRIPVYLSRMMLFVASGYREELIKSPGNTYIDPARSRGSPFLKTIRI